ncbi:hypothetical protein Nepgr_003117, partial [Nepenthes gracilis]
GTTTDEICIYSSSSPSSEMLTCSRPLMERRLRPPHDQALKCPRCESTHTKFCYYNNYSLSQPRYFCKTCRRYWTKGGTLRNIPVGGGCRKSKKSSNPKKSPISDHQLPISIQNPLRSSSQNLTDLQLSFPDVQFSQLANLISGSEGFGNPDYNYMDNKYNMSMVENPTPIDFMESKFHGCHDFMGSGCDFMGIGELGSHGLAPNFNGFCPPLDGNNSHVFMGNFQRLMLPYDGHDDRDQNASSSSEVKPNTKLLSLEWQDPGCPDSDHVAGKDLFGYNNVHGLTSWGSGGYSNAFGPPT